MSHLPMHGAQVAYSILITQSEDDGPAYIMLIMTRQLFPRWKLPEVTSPKGGMVLRTKFHAKVVVAHMDRAAKTVHSSLPIRADSRRVLALSHPRGCQDVSSAPDFAW